MNRKTIWILILWSFRSAVILIATPIPQVPIGGWTPSLPFWELLFPDDRHSTTVERGKLENEFKDYFGDNNNMVTDNEDIRTIYWASVLILDRYDTEIVRQMCAEAYDVMSRLPEYAKTPNGDATSEIWIYEVFYVHLLIGAEAKKMRVVVLECEKHDVGIFYITKGRRSNSVYFVKPTVPREATRPLADVTLDEKFDSDVELETDFKALSFSVMKRRHELATKLADGARFKKKDGTRPEL